MDAKKIDWEAIETTYCAGIVPVRKIAQQHGVPYSSVAMRAKRAGWARDLTYKIEKRAKSIVVNNTGISNCDHVTKKDVTKLKKMVTCNKKKEHEIIESAATLIAAVQIAHRGEIAELRRQARGFREELDSASKEDLPAKERLQMFGMLTSAYGQVIRLEREAYGIDKSTPPSDERDRTIKVEIVSPGAAARVTVGA